MKTQDQVYLVSIVIKLVITGIICGGIFITGCKEETPSHFKTIQSPIGEDLFSRSRFHYINQIFGYPDTNDFQDVWDYWNETSNRLVTEDRLLVEDTKMFTVMMRYLVEQLDMAEEEYIIALAQGELTTLAKNEDAVMAIIEMTSYTGIGEVMNELFLQLGRDWLPHHLYPIFQHYFTMPYDIYTGYVDGIKDADPVTKISDEEFETLMEVIRRMLDDKDPVYGPIWDAMPSAWDMIRRIRDYGDNATVKNGKDLLDALLDFVQDMAKDGFDIGIDGNDDLAEKLSDALQRVWDNESGEGELETKYLLNDADDTLDYTLAGDKQELDALDPRRTREVRQELRKMLYSVGLMMTEEIDESIAGTNFNSWDDRAMTDLERVLYSIEDVLDVDTLPRSHLELLLEGLLSASIDMNGANSLGGALRGLAVNDPTYLQGLDHSLIQLFTKDRDGNDRASSTSALRALLYMVYSMRNMNIAGMFGSLDGCNLLTSLTCTNSRNNMLDWALGEIAAGQDSCPIPFVGGSPPCTNPFQGFDYMLYEKDYGIVFPMPPIYLFSSSGLFGLLNNGLVSFGMALLGFDQYISSAYVAVGLDAANFPGKTGMTHQMLGPVAPILKHFWDWSETNPGGDWVHPAALGLASLNEIAGGWNVATTDPFLDDSVNGQSVMKAIEGPNGYGLATYALRRHYDPSDPPLNANLEHGLIDPVLNMLVMVINELETTGYTYQDDYHDCTNGYTLYPYDGGSNSCALLSALMFYIENNTLLGLNMDNWNDTDNNDIGEYNLIYDLFHDTDSQGDTVLDITEESLTDFHDIIAILLQDFGPVILAVIEDQDRYNDIMTDIDKIRDILDKLEFDSGFGENNGFGDLLEHLLEENEDGSDNRFVANIKAIIIKALDLEAGNESDIVSRHNLERTNEDDRQYYKDLYKNIQSRAAWWFKERYRDDDIPKGEPIAYQGKIDDYRSLADLVKHLFGEDDDLEGGIYSMTNVKDFVDEIADSDLDLFGWFVEDLLHEILVENQSEEDTGVDLLAGMASGLGFILWDIYTYGYITPTLFGEVDLDENSVSDWSSMYTILSCLSLETDMNGFLDDNILFWGGEPMRPGGVGWRVWYNIFIFYAESRNIFQTYEDLWETEGLWH